MFPNSTRSTKKGGRNVRGWRIVLVWFVASLTAPSPVFAGSVKSFTDIVFEGHGNGYTRKGRPIRLSLAKIERLQNSILEAMTATPDTEDQSGVPVLDPSYVKSVLSGFDFEKHESVLVRGALIEAGLDQSPTQDYLGYAWRANLIHRLARGFFPPNYREFREAFEKYLTTVNLGFLASRRWIIDRSIGGYNGTCSAEGVPVPPDIPIPTAAELAAPLPVALPGGWMLQGDLPRDQNFLDSGRPARVLTYLAPGDLGLCYALPRMFAEGRVNLLGVICQGKASGKACFWDNLNPADARLHYLPGETMKLAEVQNGAVLDENCTKCHRGQNAFNIHPETPLGNIPRAVRDADVRYQPLGQVMSAQGPWENPAPLSPFRTGPCSGCHEIGAAVLDFYCGILDQAMTTTMPSVMEPALRRNRDVALAAFAAHTRTIRDACGL